MNRIMGRAKVMLALILVLAIGISIFMVEYFRYGGTWVHTGGSPHIYEEEQVLGCGIVTDRDGILLLDMANDGVYNEDALLRKSVIHWVGDRRGNILAPALNYYDKELAGYDPVNGVYAYGGIGGKAKLTLSAKLQAVALEAMEDRVGTVALYNYKTGQILCAVTTPTFDPDQEPDIAGDTTGEYEGVYLNRFIQSTYTPGSIFKVLTAAAALECIPDIMEQSFTCTGEVGYGVDKVTCQNVHGTVSFSEALMYSCNCSFARIANQVGGQRLMEYARKFGILDKVTFDGITTAAGSIQPDSESGVTVAWTGIGQHKDLINPCTYLSFIGAVANDGVLLTPHLVTDITTGGEKTYQTGEPQGVRIMSEQTANTLRQMMLDTVSDYYGTEGYPDVSFGAKSGTAQVGADKKPNAMFTGFIDEEQMPLAFIVCVEDGGAGRRICGPVIQKLLQAAYEYLMV